MARAEAGAAAANTPTAGAISAKEFVVVNGVRQGLFVRGRDVRNPILLYLHGGMPDVFLSQRHPTGLEDLFTVVWWELRGAGLSSRGVPPRSVTVEQVISDTLALTDYLRTRFARERIYIMGHSGGTFIAIQAVARAPERYSAYVGVAQMANQLESEKLAYDYMLERFRENGNRRMVRRLEAAPVTMTGGTPRAYLALRDGAMHSLGVGTMHEMRSVVTGLILPSLAFRGYTWGEKMNLWWAKMRSGVSALWGDMLATDLAATVPELRIPAYFFHGRQDYTCAYAVAKEYVDALRAPVKGFYTFERSAHSPIFEEPARSCRILREDVLAGCASLADPA